MNKKLLLDIELKKAMLREKYEGKKEAYNQKGNKQELTAGTFKIEQNLSRNEDGFLIISGTALAEGTYHGLFYPAEEIEMGASGLVGVDLRFDHKKVRVGEVLTAKYKNKKLLFNAIVTDSECIKKVLSGHFDSVSTGVRVEIRNVGQRKVAYDLEFVELSLTKDPACPSCKIDKIVSA